MTYRSLSTVIGVSGVVLSLALVGCGEGLPTARVTLGTATIEGDVNADSVGARLQSLEPAFEACYTDVILEDETAEGTMRLRLRGIEGQLTAEVLENATGNTELAECIAGAFPNLAVAVAEDSLEWTFTGEWQLTFELIDD